MIYLVSYGELALKGRNRKYFENKLKENLKYLFKRERIEAEIKKLYGKIMITSDTREEVILEHLKKIPGIANIFPVYKLPLNYDVLKNEIVDIVKRKKSVDDEVKFRISANRAYKHFPIHSMDVNMEIGGIILGNFPKFKVDLKHPELDIAIDIRGEGIFISFEKIKGLGGFPEGSQGKGLLLLSGGLDSPVAAYSMIKRGMRTDFIYFHTPPFTSEKAREKVESLAKTVKKSISARDNIRLYVVNITDLQKEILGKCDLKAGTILLRIVMLKIAEEIAKRWKYDALITGDSLGQVASQTIRSLDTVNRFVDKLILRPLIGTDKQDIMDIAKKIGTYDISIQPYDDCCALFVPDTPLTKPDFKRIKTDVEKLSLDKTFENLDAIVEQKRV